MQVLTDKVFLHGSSHYFDEEKPWHWKQHITALKIK